MRYTIDITGQRFGMLVATRPVRVGEKQSLKWECICDCGGSRVESAGQLRTGCYLSCGCSTRRLKSESNIKTKGGHGASRSRTGRPTRTYQSWLNMIGRCHRQYDDNYERYGACGIAVCDRWRDDFTAFLEDMGERPIGATIDRIDNSRGYEPGNCRWATAKQQAANRRSTKLTDDATMQIRWLRADGGFSRAQIAKAFGIYVGYLDQIVRGDRRTD